MKVLLTTLNAKYIHTSLALRWLYVANKERFDISFQEYTIKESIERIAEEILANHVQVLGISVSIWNVQQSQHLAIRLKQLQPDLKIILGGPEVSYEPEYFIENWPIDFVISGEGEFVLGQLLEAINNNASTEIDSVSSKNKISRIAARADLERLSSLPSPYQLESDETLMENRLIYFETSRGCPYQCQYCLSSLEKGVRYFPQQYIEDNLIYLIDSKVRQIKFLDRTFNLNKKHTNFVFNLLLRKHRDNLVFQFEIYADLLDESMLMYLQEKVPKKYFRFEIGIQSTFKPTNQAVRRKQDFPLLAHNIRKLMAGDNIDLHLDLIAGLPHETYSRFVQSFNDVFELNAKEVQLGFLKLLRGTGLRKNAQAYGYKFAEEAPYEIISSNDISETELERIREAEHALEKFWNSGRFQSTMQGLIEKEYKGCYFQLFDEIGQYYVMNNLPHHGYQLEDLFLNLHNFLLSKNIDAHSTLRNDYYSNFKVRPQGYWMERAITKQERKRLHYEIGQDKNFLRQFNLTRHDVEKHAVIDRLGSDNYLLTFFLPHREKGDYLQMEYAFEE